ncbi:hypothetical protein K2173_027834 [Erythroxylum novogranatense]|uniref:C2H2-type domain-containing protein n=1 Tax=Erythroxylum novogranatense TaxID=1862640 RepID=A0AAV8U029_9ROSI|nr:hypothetical protein K2173_027834 [Erythroxylum novogranatense]
MAILTFLPDHTAPKKQLSKRKISKQLQKQKHPTSWDQIKNLLTCKQLEGSSVHDPSKNFNGYSKLGSSCSSIYSFGDVVHGDSRVVHRADNSPQNSTGLLSGSSSLTGTGRSNAGGNFTSSSRGMQLRKLSGCYECHTIVDPSRYSIIPRTSIATCSHCGEVFPKFESLELHQKVRHAVSELGPEDSGRNVVEMIFKSSWLKEDNPICKIERILKVQNTQRTIQRFEDCRNAVKTRALNSTRKNPRCAADGNELLRFYCTRLICCLGACSTSSLCGAVPACGACTAIGHGFQVKGTKGVRTTASSGRAHDSLIGYSGTDGLRAMIVCRVIAGRVKCLTDTASLVAEEDGGVSAAGSYDSVARNADVYSDLEELFVFNPRAILPCFVVIYNAQ